MSAAIFDDFADRVFMQNEDFPGALRRLDAPYFLDGEGSAGVLGTQYGATTPDGAAVTIIRLHDQMVESMRDVDRFVGTLGSRAHRSATPGSILGAGITPAGGVFVVGARDMGISLADRLMRDGSLSSKDLREIAVRSAVLLEEYCSTGICHGLVMPQTVMITTDGGVMFRWGGLFTAFRAAGVTPSDIGRLLHFNSYLAPELRDGSTENATSDVFSLGATLYEALTGRPPFGGRTTATVMAAVLADGNEPRDRLSSEALRAVVLRAIERDPHDRWQDPTHFRNALAPPVASTPGAVGVGKQGCLGMVVLGVGALVVRSTIR